MNDWKNLETYEKLADTLSKCLPAIRPLFKGRKRKQKEADEVKESSRAIAEGLTANQKALEKFYGVLGGMIAWNTLINRQREVLRKAQMEMLDLIGNIIEVKTNKSRRKRI